MDWFVTDKGVTRVTGVTDRPRFPGDAPGKVPADLVGQHCRTFTVFCPRQATRELLHWAHATSAAEVEANDVPADLRWWLCDEHYAELGPNPPVVT